MRRRQQPQGATRCATTWRNRQRRIRGHRRERTLLYRAPVRTVGLLTSLVTALTIIAVATGYILVGAVVVATTVLTWLALVLRVARLEPAGPRGDGPTPPGGAGVREPRRPLPFAPAGAAAMSVPDDEPPTRTVAIA